MLKKTPLHQSHVELNAQMVDFYGWSMPINYGSQIKEHHAVREHCGLFDVSHMGIVDITGADAKEFLQNLLANDISKCKDNSALYSCMLNENGGIIDDLITYRLTADHYRLIINSACAKSDIAWIRQQAKENNFNMNVQQLDGLAILAVQGPAATSLLNDLIDPEKLGVINLLKPFKLTQYKSWMIARTGYTGENGYEIILPKEQAASIWKSLIKSGATPCGLGARDTLRLEAGLNLYGKDMTTGTSPLCANLAWTVDFSNPNRDFIGKEALLKEKEIGPAEHLIGLYLNSRGVLRDGQILYCNNEPCGLITSGSYSPTLNKAIAFARIEHKYMPSQINSNSPIYSVKIREKQKEITLVKPPFARNGKSCIKPILVLNPNQHKEEINNE